MIEHEKIYQIQAILKDEPIVLELFRRAHHAKGTAEGPITIQHLIFGLHEMVVLCDPPIGEGATGLEYGVKAQGSGSATSPNG